MGVKDLSWIVRENKQKYSVRYELRNTRLVIDGRNFLRAFWKYSSIPFKCGGDYEMYATNVKDFFSLLERCKISPYVVLNGAHAGLEHSKSMPTAERGQERVDCMEGVLKIEHMDAYQMLPILARETFCQVLGEMGVPHVTCEKVSAKAIAVLAKKWKCPVYSNSSDFFVYPLEGGFINFDEAWNAPFIITEGETPYIEVTLYRYELFETRGELPVSSPCTAPDTLILPYYAVLLGNGRMNPDYLAKMYECIRLPNIKGRRKILTERLLEWLLSNRDTIEDAIKNITRRSALQTKILEAVKKATSEYVNLRKFSAMNLQEFFETACKPDAKAYELSRAELSNVTDSLPDWFLVACRHSLISEDLQNAVLGRRVLLDCQVEDINMPSSHDCSKELRKIVYGIICGDEEKPIRELDRAGKYMKGIEVQPSSGIPGYSPLPTLETMTSYTKAETIKLFLKALQLPDNIISNTSPLFMKVFAGLVCLLLRDSKRPIRIGNRLAIIWGTLLLQVKYMAEHREDVDEGADEDQSVLRVPEEVRTAYNQSSEQQLDDLLRTTLPYFEEPSKPSVNIIHGFSMYQSCHMDARHLSEVLMSPIPLPSPRLMCHGSLFYNLCVKLESDRDPQGFAEDLLVKGSPLSTLGLEISRMVSNVFGR